MNMKQCGDSETHLLSQEKGTEVSVSPGFPETESLKYHIWPFM